MHVRLFAKKAVAVSLLAGAVTLGTGGVSDAATDFITLKFGSNWTVLGGAPTVSAKDDAALLGNTPQDTIVRGFVVPTASPNPMPWALGV